MPVHIVLHVADVVKSHDFYVNDLGCARFPGDHLPGPDGRPAFGAAGFDSTNIMFDATDPIDDTPGPRGRGVVLQLALPESADIDALYASLKDKGVPMTQAIQDTFWGDRTFMLTDPDGYTVMISKKVFDASMDDMVAGTAQPPTDSP